MNEFEPVDLSLLDPAADGQRWSLVVETTRLRVAAVLRARELDPASVIIEWARPILAAAALMLLLLGGLTAALGRNRGPASEARRLARLSESSVLHGRPPTGAQFMAAIAAQERSR
jgi:hypothetical protein